MFSLLDHRLNTSNDIFYLFTADDLFFLKTSCQGIKYLSFFGQDLNGPLMLFFHYLAGLLINYLSSGLTEIFFLLSLNAKILQLLMLTVGERSELLAHSQAGDH